MNLHYTFEINPSIPKGLEQPQYIWIPEPGKPVLYRPDIV